MICQEPGCDALPWKLGWCKPHGNEEINGADPADLMLEGICMHGGCPKRTHARDLCKSHYERTRIRLQDRTGPRCSVVGCNRLRLARGLCRLDYDRWWRKGGLTEKRIRTLCQVKDCPRLTKARGLCDSHYRRVLRTGSTEEGRPLRSGLCARPDCGRLIVDRQLQLCRRHYAEVKRPMRRNYKGLPVPQHGRTGYSSYGCRCDVCGDAERSYQQRYRARRRRLIAA